MWLPGRKHFGIPNAVKQCLLVILFNLTYPSCLVLSNMFFRNPTSSIGIMLTKLARVIPCGPVGTSTGRYGGTGGEMRSRISSR